MSTQLGNTGTVSAYEDYVRRLSTAIGWSDQVADPSNSLANERWLYEKILRDPVAAHAIRYRKHLAAGRRVIVEPASDEMADKRAADVVGELLGQLHRFTDARISLLESIFRGSAYAAITGERRQLDVAGLGRQAWWVPTRLHDVDRRRFMQRRNAETGAIEWHLWSVEREAWEPLGDRSRWFVRCTFEDVEASLGYGRGLLDTLFHFQALKSATLRDVAQASERFGQGVLTVGIEGFRGPDGRARRTAKNDGPDDLAAYWAAVTRKHMGRHGAIVHDARDKPGFLTGFGEGYQLLFLALSYLDVAQVTAVLGSSLNTMQSIGEVGSNAKAITHEHATEALIQADRDRLGDDLTEGLVKLLWDVNRPQLVEVGLGEARMPRLTIPQEQLEDHTANAGVIAQLLGLGVPIKREEVYARTGFSQPLPDDEVVEGQPAPVPGDPLAGLGGFGLGGFGFSNLPATGGPLLFTPPTTTNGRSHP